MSDLHNKAAGIYELKHYIISIIVLETNTINILSKQWRELESVSYRLTLRGKREKEWRRKERIVYTGRFISMQKWLTCCVDIKSDYREKW